MNHNYLHHLFLLCYMFDILNNNLYRYSLNYLNMFCLADHLYNFFFFFYRNDNLLYIHHNYEMLMYHLHYIFFMLFNNHLYFHHHPYIVLHLHHLNLNNCDLNLNYIHLYNSYSFD